MKKQQRNRESLLDSRSSQEATLVLQGRKMDKLRLEVAQLQQKRQKRRWLSFFVWTAGGAIACSLGILGAVKLQEKEPSQSTLLAREPKVEEIQPSNPSQLSRSETQKEETRTSVRASQKALAEEPGKPEQTSSSQPAQEKKKASSKRKEANKKIETVRFDDVAH